MSHDRVFTGDDVCDPKPTSLPWILSGISERLRISDLVVSGTFGSVPDPSSASHKLSASNRNSG